LQEKFHARLLGAVLDALLHRAPERVGERFHEHAVFAILGICGWNDSQRENSTDCERESIYPQGSLHWFLHILAGHVTCIHSASSKPTSDTSFDNASPGHEIRKAPRGFPRGTASRPPSAARPCRNGL